jgi:hypothetical protein
MWRCSLAINSGCLLHLLCLRCGVRACSLLFMSGYLSRSLMSPSKDVGNTVLIFNMAVVKSLLCSHVLFNDGGNSEKCILKPFYHCVNVIECTHTI